MAFEKVEYSFPDEQEDVSKPEIEIERSSAIEIDLDSGKKEKVKPEPVEVTKEIEIEVVNDTPKADRNRKVSEPPEDVTDEELENYSEKVRKRMQHFSKGYHDERRAKEAAFREKQELETLAQSLVDENKKLKGSVNKNQTALLEQAKKGAKSELETAKNAYKSAYESGDADAVVAAQESLTSAKIKTDKLNNYKIPALQDTETPVGKVADTQSTPAQPVADERATTWAKANPWFGTDDEMTSLALGLHTKLAKQGMNLQSDEYYEAINTRMQQLFPEEFEDVAQLEVEKPKRKANVVAPATRSTSPRKVTLTQTQVSVAKRLGLTPEQYAKQVAIEMRKDNG
jgi:hypothetical protein